MRPVAEEKSHLRVCSGHAKEDLPRVNADAGKVSSQAISRVEGDLHSPAIVAWRLR
jgi:hypothetical protein